MLDEIPESALQSEDSPPLINETSIDTDKQKQTPPDRHHRSPKPQIDRAKPRKSPLRPLPSEN